MGRQLLTGSVIFIVLSLLFAHNAFSQSNETSAALIKIDQLLIDGEVQQAWQLLDEIQEGDIAPDKRLWLKSRGQYEMGRVAGKKPLPFYKKAEKFARSAIKESPSNPDGYKWLAITRGAQAKFSDTKEQVKISKEVKKNIEKAISLDPEDDISYLILSRWHYKNSRLSSVARTFAKLIYGGLPKASLKESEKLLLQAIKLHDRVAHRYNLAKVYNRMERPNDEVEQLQKALLLPVTFPEEKKEKEKAREKLSKKKM